MQIGPLIGAISAGNCCVVKVCCFHSFFPSFFASLDFSNHWLQPSELTSRTERLLQEKLLRYIDPDCFQVVCGALPASPPSSSSLPPITQCMYVCMCVC